MSYDVDFFIAKFEAIPEERWTMGTYHDGPKSCVLGHCGGVNGNAFGAEPEALRDLFAEITAHPAVVNDNEDDRFPQETPKARVLAALHTIKEQNNAKRG